MGSDNDTGEYMARRYALISSSCHGCSNVGTDFSKMSRQEALRNFNELYAESGKFELERAEFVKYCTQGECNKAQEVIAGLCKKIELARVADMEAQDLASKAGKVTQE